MPGTMLVLPSYLTPETTAVPMPARATQASTRVTLPSSTQATHLLLTLGSQSATPAPMPARRSLTQGCR